jgi:hypothetical protein
VIGRVQREGRAFAYNQEVDKTGGYPMPECPEPYARTWTRAPALFPTQVIRLSGYQRNRSSRDDLMTRKCKHSIFACHFCA